MVLHGYAVNPVLPVSREWHTLHACRSVADRNKSSDFYCSAFRMGITPHTARFICENRVSRNDMIALHTRILNVSWVFDLYKVLLYTTLFFFFFVY